MNLRGERCGSLAGSDGLCSAHRDPERMRELGRKGGRGRSKPNPERVHESLRSYLKREVPPERVWRALEAAMLGNSESARVSASRVLMDALAAPQQDRDEQAKVDRQYAISGAKSRLSSLLKAGLSPEEAAEALDDEAIDDHPYLIRHETPAEKAGEVLEMLYEAGVFDWKVEQLAQKRAEEITRAFREEHGLPAAPVA
jgi:hypothetical protein